MFEVIKSLQNWFLNLSHMFRIVNPVYEECHLDETRFEISHTAIHSIEFDTVMNDWNVDTSIYNPLQ